MSQLNPLKFYSLAVFHLLLPKIIKRKFYFKTSPTEYIAIGNTMNRIWYWKSFLNQNFKNEKEDYFFTIKLLFCIYYK